MTFGGVLGGLGAAASLVWIVRLGQVVGHRKVVRRLADLPADAPEGGWPSLTVAFAARNEAASVERAARSMRDQDYPGLEVVAVDDRSTDATGAILDALAAEAPRLKVVHVTELPAGWLGKNHALQTAADASRADWLLLTDADVIFAPGALRKAVAFALASRADHVTVVPEVPTDGVGERLFLTMFQLAFLLNAPVWAVEERGRGAYLGVGAFNLIRAEAFRAIGGLRRLALSVDEDVRLGQALKVAGFQTRVLLGDAAVTVRWHAGLAAMIRGLEKNFFAALDFRLVLALLGALFLLWVGATPHLGLFVGPTATRVVCGLGVATLCVLVGLTGRANRIGWWYALVLPLGALALVLALARSTWATLRHRGVRWRDHLYPLADLRAHARRRNAWTREVWRSTR